MTTAAVDMPPMPEGMMAFKESLEQKANYPEGSAEQNAYIETLKNIPDPEDQYEVPKFNEQISQAETQKYKNILQTLTPDDARAFLGEMKVIKPKIDDYLQKLKKNWDDLEKKYPQRASLLSKILDPKNPEKFYREKALSEAREKTQNEINKVIELRSPALSIKERIDKLIPLYEEHLQTPNAGGKRKGTRKMKKRTQTRKKAPKRKTTKR